MNTSHDELCASPEWAAHLHDEVLPLAVARAALGKDLLEVGPGPGAATEWLRTKVDRLVAVEIETAAASLLADRFAGTNVEIRQGSGVALDFADASFDSAASFTMLHHVPTAALQNRLLAEILRVLRPGGVLVGSDSLPSQTLHAFHEGDIYNPVEPAAFLVRLQTLGYVDITLGVGDRLTFSAHKPAPKGAQP
ncbi:Methylase involved in ubiquinone/menaquinone biosynthesis [Streptomyces sp. SceaMP-e96]|uniref:class I SAM-dependent methyltransferase n=1 Tax=Streptomyces TaxID=1883 RepID=UPI000823F0B1|nr:MULTISPECIES: class I SAM-dependent methyltransferase [unclassified Streptomyces]MYT13556.1 methyltransferase domain-containing protein [Streptomyces sp. SID4951]SCK52656.1 Methylase involved in ubiquinone/menaquinone biosynthesis [Streptomyces sp. SceaMP-e96]